MFNNQSTKQWSLSNAFNEIEARYSLELFQKRCLPTVSLIIQRLTFSLTYAKDDESNETQTQIKMREEL